MVYVYVYVKKDGQTNRLARYKDKINNSMTENRLRDD